MMNPTALTVQVNAQAIVNVITLEDVVLMAIVKLVIVLLKYGQLSSAPKIVLLAILIV